ncbi:MAG: hypothetical protein QM831_20540 [Kofleriaceae bacterium]
MIQHVLALTPSQWTQIALVLFVGVFVAVAIRERGRREEHDAAAKLPLGDD